MKKQVLIILPTYNEAENIGLMLGELLKVAKTLKSYQLSILVVDDKSPDGTAQIAKHYQEVHQNILLLSGPKSGLGDAYIRAMKYGLQQGDYYAFIMMDADFSHNPSSIPALLDKLAEQNDYVIGSRYVAGGYVPGTWPMLRILNSRFANFVAKLFVGFDKEISDVTGGFKAIRVDALRQISLDDINATGYCFQVSLLYAFVKEGYRVTEVPISFADRKHGNSKLAYKDVLEFLYRIYLLNPNSPARRICNFALVGLSGTAVNLVTLTILLRFLHLESTVADALAIEVSILSNYLLNNRYTFKNTEADDRTLRETWLGAGKFNLAAISGAVVSLAIFTVLFKFAHINYVFADLLAIGLSMSWNYWMSVKFVWKVVHADS
jgi:dolichol-phosphate mannosyltransferase